MLSIRARILVFALWSCLAGVLPAAPPTVEAPCATGHVLVKFRKERCADLLAQPGTGLLKALEARLSLPDGATLEEPRLRRIRRQARAHPQRHEDLDKFFYLKLPSELGVDQCLERLRNHPLLEYAEPDGIGQGGVIPDDPDFFRQWHHLNTVQSGADINTPAAWEVTEGSTNIIVAVLDSGLRVTLQEFSGRVLSGYDFANDDNDPDDDHGHGTAVAGTLLATGDNNLTVAGVDWHCRILPVKVLRSDNTGFYSWWADGIDFAVSQGAKVINLSAGGSGSSSPLNSAIDNAIANGVIFVCITHNDGSGVVRYPGNLPQSITVGATNEQDERAGFSNYGPQIDLVAPGTNIWTLSTSGSRTRWWGTSFAAPLVSGVCALLLSCNPDLQQEDALRLLALGAQDQVGDANDTPGFDDEYGWGRLNAFNSLLLVKTQIDSVVTTNDHGVVLSWPSPANASDKQPFHVEFSASAEGPWSTFADPANFQYQGARTFWIDDGSLTGDVPTKFFRLHLRGL